MLCKAKEVLTEVSYDNRCQILHNIMMIIVMENYSLLQGGKNYGSTTQYAGG